MKKSTKILIITILLICLVFIISIEIMINSSIDFINSKSVDTGYALTITYEFDGARIISNGKRTHNNIVVGGYYDYLAHNEEQFMKEFYGIKVIELNEFDVKMMLDKNIITLKYGEEYEFKVSPFKYTARFDKK